MAPRPSVPSLFGIPLLPSRRVIAVDPGGHSLKVLLVEEFLGRIRVVRRELVDLHAEGLLSAEDAQKHLAGVLEGFGPYPIALVLPQRHSLSQVLDLPAAPGREVQRLIEEETVKLSGLSESAIAYDHARLRPFARHAQPFWVTFCREEDVWTLVQRIGLPREDVAEVSSVSSALATAWLARFGRGGAPTPGRVALVDFGASQTVVTIVADGQAVDVASFQFGSDALTGVAAGSPDGAWRDAENSKRLQDIQQHPAGDATREKAMQWQAEVRRTLAEWLAEQGEAETPPESIPVVLTGGGAAQPGLVAFLNQSGPLRFTLWPEDDEPGEPGRFAVAWGAALQALGRSRQPVSLLPRELRQVWSRHRALHTLNSICISLVLVAALVLAFGTWKQFRLLSRKQALLDSGRAALQTARHSEALATRLVQDYEALRPVLLRQRDTADTLKALSLLQQTRGTQSFWYVLFADQASYFTAIPATNAPALTNAPGPTVLASTNPLPVRPGFIAELCVPEAPEAVRQTLSQIVTDLKKDPLFANVDALPVDLRRSLVDGRLLLPDRHFALSLELRTNDLAAPTRPAEIGLPDGRPARRPATRLPDRSNAAPSSPPR